MKGLLIDAILYTIFVIAFVFAIYWRASAIGLAALVLAGGVFMALEYRRAGKDNRSW